MITLFAKKHSGLTMKITVVFFLVFTAFQASASANKSMNDAKSIPKEHKVENADVHFLLGLGYSSHSIYRGALLDSKGGLAPSGYLTYANFTFAGLALIYNHVVFHNQVISIGANYFTDHGFKKVENSNFRQLRKATFDSWIQWHLPLWEDSTMALSFHQDLKANKSQYYTFALSQGFLTNFKATTEVGYGTLRTNEYTFGAGASKGISNIDLSLGWSKTVLPRSGNLSVEYKHSIVPYVKNRNASFVRRDDNRGTFIVNTIWTL